MLKHYRNNRAILWSNIFLGSVIKRCSFTTIKESQYKFLCKLKIMPSKHKSLYINGLGDLQKISYKQCSIKKEANIDLITFVVSFLCVPNFYFWGRGLIYQDEFWTTLFVRCLLTFFFTKKVHFMN